MALKEGPYPVRKCPSVNQKFQAEFGVAKEEPNDPWVGLGIGSGRHTPTVTSTLPLWLPDGGVAGTKEAPSNEGAFGTEDCLEACGSAELLHKKWLL